MRTIIRASLLMAALALGGCAATVATGPAPDLVYVSPGVQVIADYDEPIFYSDGFYWRYYGGTWYRSTYYTGGWVYARPPVAVLRVDRPYAYSHYRPQGWVGHARTYPPQRAAAPGGWRSQPQPAPANGWRGGPQAAPAPGWRSAPPPAAAARRPPNYAPARPAPAPSRGGPPPSHGGPPASHGGGWRGHQ